MKHYDAIIWDLDGTLLDTLDDLTDSVNASLAANSLPLKTREEVRSFVGNGIRLLLERCIQGGESNPKFESVFGFFKEHYAKNCLNKTKPYDGIQKLLKALGESGCKMAIVSNKADFAVRDLAAQFFPDSISAAIGESSAVSKKPCPDMVFEALRVLAVPLDKAVYVGDSQVDIETARNAGMNCISVTWGFRDREVLVSFGAQSIADTPDELEKLLIAEKINKNT